MQNFGAEVTAVGLRVRPRPSRRGRRDRRPDLLGNGGERAGGGALRCPRHEGLAAIRRGGERGVEGHAAEERDAGVAGEKGGVGAGKEPGHVLDERSEEHTSELQSHSDIVCRLLLEKKKKKAIY